MNIIDKKCMAGFVQSAQYMADQAGQHIRKANLKPFSTEFKSDGSPVTEVDKKTEDIIRDIITDRYPDHGILGEEHEAHSPEAEFIWVIDPIDGTLAFLAGIPVFGTLISLVHGDKPILGIVDMPVSGDRWIGQQGKPTLHNSTPVRTRSCPALKAALLSTSNPDFYDSGSIKVFEKLKAVTRQTVYGGSCMAYGQLASGRIDISIDATFDIHDYLALVSVIEGAGGRLTDWKGNALSHKTGTTNILAAGDPKIHTIALACIAN